MLHYDVKLRNSIKEIGKHSNLRFLLCLPRYLANPQENVAIISNCEAIKMNFLVPFKGTKVHY